MVNYIFLLFRLMVHGHGNFATHLTRQLTKKKTRIIHPKSGSRDRLAAVTRIGTSLRSPSWWEVGSVSHPTPASSTIWSLEPALTGTWSKLRRTTLISVRSKWNSDDFIHLPFTDLPELLVRRSTSCGFAHLTATLSGSLMSWEMLSERMWPTFWKCTSSSLSFSTSSIWGRPCSWVFKSC